MLYIAKIVAAFLLPPGIFILLLAFLALYLWRRRKMCGNAWGYAAVICCLFYALSIAPVARLLLGPLEARYEQSSLWQGADVVVVLGGGAVGDVPDLGEQGSLLGYSASRLLTGARIAKLANIPIMVSGGQVFADGANEAQISKRYLQQLGFNDKQIITEAKARNTEENAKYTVVLCKQKEYEKILLVASAFHMPRAMLRFEQAAEQSGIEVLPFPCDYQQSRANGSLSYRDFIPREDAWEQSYLALHEWLGLLAAKMGI